MFFDGYLPEDKIDTRVSRCSALVNTLQKLKQQHPNGFSSQMTKDGNPSTRHSHCKALSDYQLFRQQSCPEEHRGSNSMPFLVPAVLGGLRSSEYGKDVSLVAGEAEVYCASQVAESGGIILTGDSDALLFDLEDHHSLAFFDELELVENIDGQEKLLAPRYYPNRIAKRLQIPNLSSLADLLLQHPSWSLNRLIGHLKDVRYSKHASPLTKPQLVRPKEPLQSSAFYLESTLFHENLLAHFKRYERLLFPRLSEPILQLARSDRSTPVQIFLAPLLEDWQRVSAWASGENVRRLAYWCLVYMCATSFGDRLRVIKQWSRRASQFTSTTWTIDALTEYQPSAKLARKLNKNFVHLNRHFPQRNTTYERIVYWRSFATRFLFQGLGYTCVDRLFRGNATGKWKWDDIHANAQIEACLYSFHMLHQALQYVRSLDVDRTLPRPMEKLRDNLSTLPRLRTLLPTRWELAELASGVASQYNDDVVDFVNCRGCNRGGGEDRLR